MTADIGLIGLAVMGQNLILNMNDHGFTVVVYNRTVEKVDAFLKNEAKGTNVLGSHSIAQFVASLKKPRKIILLVKAGQAVDDFISQLVPLLEKGDIIIDSGNSNFQDSIRRCQQLESMGLFFVGCGVSGGEEGARHGPSIMPGGSPAAWTYIAPIFQAICAKSEGEPCCEWVGSGGAGHFVKTVHNGIEYGDMQLICEAYHLMREGLQMSSDEISKVFAEWNTKELDSFLIQITSEILRFKDQDGSHLVEKIKDTAGQKGTGKWTVNAALDYGIPITLISEAVFSRFLSSIKDERVFASKNLPGPSKIFRGDKAHFISEICKALYASKIISYAQGFMLLRETSKSNNWDLNFGGVALMWRGGCIIRSAFLKDIKRAYDADPNLINLLLAPFFKSAIADCQSGWRSVVAQGSHLGIPLPAISTALAFYDGYRSAYLPANLLQAQRDYFGAHTYELESSPGTFHHTNWTGRGGSVSSTSYTA